MSQNIENNENTTRTSIPIWQRITARLIFNTVVLAIVPIVIVAAATLYFVSQALSDRTFNELEAISELKTDDIEGWVEDSQGALEILLNLDSFSRNATALLQSQQEDTEFTFVEAEINDALLSVVEGAENLESIFVYNMEGQIRFSSDELLIGRVVTRQPFYNTSLLVDGHVQAPYFDVGRQQLVMVTTSILRDSRDTPVGIIGGYLNIDVLNEIVAERVGLGETGETYLVSLENNYLLTPSRFEGYDQNRAYNSPGIDAALAGNAGNEIFVNYRDVPVYSTYRFVPELQAALMTEIEVNEANRSLFQIIGVTGTIAGITLLVAVAVGLLVALGISRPLTTLTEVARRLTDGDFDQRADLDSQDEVGVLAKSFNAMAGQVQDLVGSLEQRVASRTADLATSAEIAAAANQIRERDELISLTVNLIRDRFDFYYVQAYLLDEAGEYAVLSDGTGYAGRRLLGRNHRLPLDGRSLVATTVKSRQPVVVQDTSTDERWLPNELLPDTRSEIVVPLRTQDEIIGVLDIQHSEANIFDETAQQLFQTLADQLAVTFENVNLLEGTEERARQLATVSEVAIEASTERDIDKMLRTASQLTRDNFNLYHAHVYLFNELTNRMELVAGAGEAGYEMVSNFHGIALENDNSIVVQAVRTQEPVIANDITQAPNFLPNPLLPDTRSEMAVPMIVAGRVLGVLDVQDQRIKRFGTEDAQVLQILAAQLAVAVDNVQTVERAEAQARELDRIFNSTIDMLGASDFEGNFVQLNDAWEDTLGWSKEELMAEPFFNFVHPDDIEKTTEANAGIAEGESLIEFTNRYRKSDGDYIHISWKATPDFDAGRINFVARDVTEQLRNEQEVIRRATKMQAITELSAEIGGELDINTLLQDVADFTKTRLNHYHAQIYLLSEDGTQLILAAGAGDVGQHMVNRGHRIKLNANSLVARAARDREIVVVNNVVAQDDHLPNPFLPRTKAELAVPILYGGQILGVLDVQDDHVDAYGEVEVQIKTTLSNQVAVAIQNARQFAETQLREADVQERATKMQAVTEISSDIGGTLDVDQLLWDVTNFAADKLDHYHVQIYLLSDDEKRLVLTAGAGERGRSMVNRGHSIAVTADSLVARAARERQIVMINNVLSVEDHLPNPNLPATKAEMAVPLLYGGQLLGVLDIQDDAPNRYTEVETQVNTTLANQVAVAIQNARQFELTQIRLQEVLATNAIADFVRESDSIEDMLENVMTVAYNSLGADNSIFSYYQADINEWQGYVGVGEGVSSDIARTFIDPGDRYPHGMEAIETREIVTVENVLTYEGFPLDFVENLGLKSVMVIPIIVDRDAIGVIFLNYNTTAHDFSDDDQRLARSIGNQISIGIQRQRSEEQVRQQTEIAQRRASELETVANVSAASTTILDVNELLQSVSDLTKQNFDLYHAHIYLYNPEDGVLTLAAGAGDVGMLMKEHGHQLSVHSQSGLVSRAARDKEVVMVNDTASVIDFLPNPMLPETRSEMAIPMLVGDEVVGVLDLQSNIVNRFDDEDIRIQSTLASQVAVAVQNALAFERERKTVERLREVDRLKQEFLANMSHELRTPLNSIIGYSEVLLDGVDGDLTEDALEDVEAIHTSGKHLLSIINEILDLAKIDAGQMRLSRQEKDVIEILKHIVVSSQVLVKDKPVEILLEEATPIEMTYIDPVRMNQIMLNLVGNAIKFTEEGSVTVRYGMDNDDFIRVEIADTGMGMNEEQLALIFQRFRQVDGSSTRRAGGTGLGLTITKQLVEMHGGEVGVTSEVNVGSTFFFTLPRLEIAKEMEAKEQAIRDAEAAALESEPVAGD